MKLFLRIASAAIICASLFSSVSAVEMSLGIKGGLNLATSHGDDISELLQSATADASMYDEDLAMLSSIPLDEPMKPGPAGGVFFKVKLSDNFSIQPEVLFMSKGLKLETTILGITPSVALNLNYLEIPMLFKLAFPLGTITPSIFAGPAVGFNLSASVDLEMDMPAEFAAMMSEDPEMDITAEIEKMEEEINDEVKDFINGIDFGIAMGGGLNIAAGPGAVILDVRYTLGFLKILKLTDEIKEEGIAESDLPKLKNSALSIMIGYAINIGG